MLTETLWHLLDLYATGKIEGWLDVSFMRPAQISMPGPAIYKTWWEVPRQTGEIVAYLKSENIRQWLSENRYGVHFSVNTQTHKPVENEHYTGAKDKYTYMSPALFIEIDRGNGGSLNKLEAFPLWPSVVINSGGGWHVCWLLNEPFRFDVVNAKQQWRRIVGGLADVLGGDTNAINPARMLRLPGFVNTKPARNGAVVKVIRRDPELWYSIDDFMPYARPEPKPTPRTPPAYTPQSNDLPTPVQNYLATGAAEGNRNNYLWWTACVMAEHGYSIGETESTLIGRAMGDSLSEQEAKTAIRSGHQRGSSGVAVPRELRNRFTAAYGVR